MLWSTAYGALYVHEHRRTIYDGVLKPAVQLMKGEPQMIPLRWAAGLLANPEHIAIDMNHKAFMKLVHQRKVALEKGHLDLDDREFVPATIRYKDHVVKVDLRLKGDWTDHLGGNKWSFRVKAKGDHTLFGMSQFSIQHPRARGYIHEWLFHRALQREGVLPLRYDFIRVALNGKNLGIYAVEEHCEKRLIEHNRLREGPIVRFDENLFWAERFQQARPFRTALLNGNGDYLSSPIDGFQLKRLLGNPASAALYHRAIYLLESFRRGDLATSEVFDTPKLSRFFAITDLMGARHATIWHNMRFYYNPITSRLEPIGFDGNSGKPLTAVAGAASNVHDAHEGHALETARATYFRDPLFYEEYIRTLERIAQPSYLDSLLRDVDGDLRSKLSILYSEFPGYHFDKSVLYGNQRYIRSVLHPVQGVHAYFDQPDGRDIALELGSIHNLPIEVLGVSCGNTRLESPAARVILPAKRPGQTVQYRRQVCGLPSGIAWSDSAVGLLRVHYRLLGASTIREATVSPWSYLGDNPGNLDFMRQPPNWKDWQFLTTDEARREITIRPGSWTIDRNLIFPKGYTVLCGGGVELNLVQSACILSYSPLQLRGTDHDPVAIVSRDSTGQGLVVIGAGDLSILDHVNFDNLANPAQAGWALTGAVTFYESPVMAIRCRFIRSRCEDALNTFRTTFRIEEATFSRTRGDAFDSDFCTGTMRNVSFTDLGNDAIDVSGSEVALSDIVIRRAGDKGISAGEGSRVSVERLEVADSEIALASKDHASLEATQVTIRRCKIGLTAYGKKPEFDAPSLKADLVRMSQVEIPNLVESGSQAHVNGSTITGRREDVASMLYGARYGKDSP